MRDRLESWLAPPIYDDERARVARLLNTVLLAMAGVALVCGPIYALAAPGVTVAAPFLVLGVSSIGLLRVLRRGHAEVAAMGLVTVVFLLTTASVLLFDGLGGALYGTYAISIVMAGVLLGGRAALGTAAASIAVGWGMVNAAEAGLLPDDLDPAVSGFLWAGMNSFFVVLGLLLLLADRNMRETLGRLRSTREALRESEERYALATRGANDGIFDWNMRTHEVYYSPRWKEMLGLDPERPERSPSAWLCRLHPDDRERVRAELDAHLAGATAHFESEHRILHEDGTYRWVLTRGLAVRDEGGEPLRMAGSQSDITSRKMVEREFEHAALHDALTGLPNRALFLDRLEHAIMRSRRTGESRYAVLFLDLDRFKVINDSLGHLAGNELLTAVARRLQHGLRPSDTAARLGGDEFAILLDGIDYPDDVDGVVERVRDHMSKPFLLGGREVYVTASIGLAPGAGSYESADDVLRDADIAMYRAKALGKDRCEEFAPDMHSEAVALLELQTDLRRALDQDDQLHVAYQPVVEIATGRIDGFEALVRWTHPQRGRISPVPMAEESGLVVEMDRWVVRTACARLQRWRERFPHMGGLRMSVNLSSVQFACPDLVPYVVEVLDDTGLPPSALCIEITESALMADTACTSDNLKLLRELGIHLAVDDFGTGYSSLGYLHRYPVDILKIDRSFVRDLESDPDKETIVRTIIGMADSMGLRVVAEGVETVEQLRALRRMSCPVVQGYLFSRPVDEVTAESYLETGGPWRAEDLVPRV
ncbi:MAG: putative bifunctional diguanylate cyclase/phosphodiesterase [Myxococcota bacterium]